MSNTTNGLDDIEAKLAKVKMAREIEHMFDLCKRGPAHHARISAIVAEDDAEAERSVRFSFSAEESATIFHAAEAVLRKRYTALKAELGAK